MNTKILALAALLCAVVSAAYAAPALTVSPGGTQSGNWVWNVTLTPDLSLIPDGSGTPVAVELGFRMTGGSLVSATNVNPSQFDTNNPGAKIFGWEVGYPDANNRPVGMEANCIGCTLSNPAGFGSHPTTIVPGINNELFVALGSGNFTTPGAKQFLRIITSGPGSGSPSSTIQWLGIYGTGSSNGRITQVTGMSGTIYTTGDFDIFQGTATQSIPEPASITLLGIGALFASRRRRLRSA